MNKNISNFLYILFIQCGNYIFPIITIPIVSRVFGPKLIGEFTYIQSLTSYFVLLISFGFSYTALRRITRNFKAKNSIFSCVFYSQSLMFFISLVIFLFLLNNVPSMKNNVLISCICFSSCFSALFDQSWIYQSFGDFKVITLVSIITKFFSMAAIVLFVRDEGDITIYAAIVSFSLVFGNFISFVYAIIRYNIEFISINIFNIVSFLKEDSFIFLSSVLSNVYTTTGVVLLGVYSTPFEVGLFTSAMKIIDLMRNISFMPLNMLVLPMVSKSFGESVDAGMDKLQRVMPIFIFFCVTSFLFINFFGEFIVNIFFGHQFSGSGKILHILSFGFLALFFGLIIGGQVILNLHYDKQFVLMQLLVAILSLSLNIFLLPHGGGMTTALVWTISEFIMTLMQIIFLYRKGYSLFNLKYFINPISSLRDNV